MSAIPHSKILASKDAPLRDLVGPDLPEECNYTPLEDLSFTSDGSVARALGTSLEEEPNDILDATRFMRKLTECDSSAGALSFLREFAVRSGLSAFREDMQSLHSVLHRLHRKTFAFKKALKQLDSECKHNNFKENIRRCNDILQDVSECCQSPLFNVHRVLVSQDSSTFNDSSWDDMFHDEIMPQFHDPSMETYWKSRAENFEQAAARVDNDVATLVELYNLVRSEGYLLVLYGRDLQFMEFVALLEDDFPEDASNSLLGRIGLELLEKGESIVFDLYDFMHQEGLFETLYDREPTFSEFIEDIPNYGRLLREMSSYYSMGVEPQSAGGYTCLGLMIVGCILLLKGVGVPNITGLFGRFMDLFRPVEPQGIFDSSVNLSHETRDTLERLTNVLAGFNNNREFQVHTSPIADIISDTTQMLSDNWVYLVGGAVILYGINKFTRGPERALSSFVAIVFLTMLKRKLDPKENEFVEEIIACMTTEEVENDEDEEFVTPQGGKFSNGIINAILGFCYYKIGERAYDDGSLRTFIRDMAPMPRFADSLSTFFEWALEVLQQFGYFIRDHTGVNIEPENWVGDAEINSYFVEVESMIKEFNNGLAINYESGQRLFSLMEKGRCLLKNYGNDIHGRDKREQLKSIMQSLRPFELRLQRSNIVGNGPRIEPLGILIGGASGIGKSSLSTSILLAIMARVLPENDLKAFHENHNDFIYNRIPETEYWDSYHGQFACLFDDIGQLRDMVGMMTSPYMEAIRAINPNNYNLHMAHLDEKGVSNFQSKLVYATTNRRRFVLESIISDEAFVRRFRMSFVQTPKDEYCLNPEEPDIFKRKLDLAKVTEIGDDEMYLWYEHDFITGETKHKCYNFNELIDVCVKHYGKMQSIGSRLLDKHQEIKLKYMASRDVKPQGGIDYFGVYKKILANFGLSPAEMLEFCAHHNVSTNPESMFSVTGELKLPEASSYSEGRDLLSHFKACGESIWNFMKSHSKVVGFLATVAAIKVGYSLLKPILLPQTGETRKRNRQRKVKKVKGSIRKVGRAPLTQNGFAKGNIDFMTKVYRKNQYFLLVNGKKIGCCTFLKGRVALVPLHFIDYIESAYDAIHGYGDECVDKDVCGVEIKLQKCAAPDLTFTSTYNDISMYMGESDTEDLGYLVFDRSIPSHCDITEYFCDRDFASDDIIYGALAVAAEKTIPILDLKLMYREDVQYTDYSAGESFSYKANTKNGDCGSVLYLSDIRVATPVILGIHVAGGKGLGYSIYIRKSKILNDLSEMGEQITYPIEEGEVGPQLNDHTITSVRVRQPRLASRSRIIPSRLYGEWGESNYAPAKLNSFKLADGTLVDVRKKARDGYSIGNPLVNRVLLELCTSSFISKFKLAATAPEPWEPRVFDFQEAVAGIAGVPYFDGLPRNTSSGYPYVFDVKKGGKKDFFGSEGEYDFSSEMCKALEADVQVIIDNCRKGIRPRCPYIDHLKDERRPKEKVAIGKTRLFSGANLAFTIVCRMYFMDIVRHCQSNKIYNGIAMGINPYSTDWSHLARYLTEKGEKVFAGDYSGFDKKTAALFQYEVLDVIESYYYNSTSEERLIRRCLFEEITNSVHVAEGVLYEWYGSTPSGTFLTTFVNSVVNNIIMRYAITACFVRSIGKDILNCRLEDYLEFMSKLDTSFNMIAFGDDNVVNISPELEGFINHTKVTEEFRRIGFEYTDETKSGLEVTHKLLNEVTFLKRGFVLDVRHRRFVAPLELEVILEAPYWTKDNVPENEVYETLFTSAKELSLHKKEVFDKYFELFQACARKYFKREIFPTKHNQLRVITFNEEAYHS